MKLKIEINLDNDVFSECPNDEICIILQRIGRQFTCADIPKDMDGKTIQDANGNTIGKIKIIDEEKTTKAEKIKDCIKRYAFDLTDEQGEDPIEVINTRLLVNEIETILDEK